MRAVIGSDRLRQVLSWCGLLLLLVGWSGCSSEEEPRATTPSEEPPETNAPAVVGRSRDLPRPHVSIRPLDVRTADAGFAVFINGQPARDAKNSGELLQTPCRVEIPQRPSPPIIVTVAKEGFQAQSQTVLGSEQTEMIFGPPEPASDPTTSVLSSPLLLADIGQPVALLSLNSLRPELDPYLEPNGLVLWFVGDRAEGRAIYRAERKTPWAFFDPPEIVMATRSGELPATPSVTAAGLLVYSVPDKARLLAVPVADRKALDRPHSLQFSSRPKVRWESSQILADGLRLYWTERAASSEDRHGQAAIRHTDVDGFQTALDFNLPGLHPCLSADGLRQYLFDGQILRRSRRLALRDSFAAPEILANLDLPNYHPDPKRRAFWVSEEEEWLYYSGSEGAGDLFAVRLFHGPGWGYRPRGERIAPRVMVAETKPVDPGSLPFIPPEIPKESMETGPSYPQFREEFSKLLKARKYSEAQALLKQAEANPRLKADQELLSWDREEITRIVGLWEAVRERLRRLAPGTEIRIGRVKVKFVKFAEDSVHFRVTKSGSKPLLEMEPSDVLALIEPTIEPNDAEAQLRLGTFSFHDAKGNPRTAERQLELAGPKGTEFVERLAGRMLHVARRDIAEGRVAGGLVSLEAVQSRYPKSSAAAEAKTLQATAYGQTKWNRLGPREWQEPEAGTFVADKIRQPSAYLVSVQAYQQFELRLEWKITEPGGSGGVFFRYANPGTREDPYRKAFKVQLADDRDLKPDPQSTGSVYYYEAPSANAAKPRGEWNTLRLRVKNLNVEIWINGKQVQDTVAQNELVPLAGFVALDGVNGGIAYRNTMLVELP